MQDSRAPVAGRLTLPPPAHRRSALAALSALPALLAAAPALAFGKDPRQAVKE